MTLSDLFRPLLRLFQRGADCELTSSIEDGILIIDRGGSIKHANPALLAMIGSIEPVTGKRYEEVLERYPDVCALCSQQKAKASVAITAGDQPRHFEITVSPILKRGRDAERRVVVFHDIGERVSALTASRENELLLRQSEEKYRYLIENINEIVTTIDLDGRITYASPSVERLVGCLCEDLIGRPFLDIVHPDDREHVSMYFSLALAGSTTTRECRIITRKGQLRQVHIYTLAIIHKGRLTGLLGVISDITERRQVEEALERRASQLTMVNKIGEQIAGAIELKRLLESAAQLIQKNFGYYHVALFIPDWSRGELEMRAASGSFSELFPRNHHLKFGQGLVGWCANNRLTLLVNDVRLDPRYTNLYPDRILTRAELAVPILAGDRLLGVLDIQSPQVNAFDDNDVRVMKTVADQIAVAMENARLYEEVRRQLDDRERLFKAVDGARSELEKRARELEEVNNRLRELDRLKSQFLANISHELRTPLNSIIGFSEVLADGIAGPLNEQQNEFILDILASGRHQLALISDLLDFSRIESGHLQLVPSWFSIQSLFDDLRVTLTPLVEKNSQTLAFHDEGSLPLIYADRLRIRQVFINLLGNANKFTPPGGCITMSSQATEPGWLLFQVTDTGIGIRSEDQDLIFEEFRQVDGSMTREVPGTGLGLTITRRLVELHGGRIWVESELSRGSTFSVLLPIRCRS
jgi:PAS domain S-box-containing protein